MSYLLSVRALLLIILSIAVSAQAVGPLTPVRAYMSPSAASAQGPETCSMTTTLEPPFYDAKSFDPQKNFLPANGSGRSEYAGYIPKNSVVKFTKQRDPSIIERFTATDYVNVQVLSTPSERTDLNARVSPPQIRTPVVGSGRRLGVGFRGSVQYQNLRLAGDKTTYFVHRDAPALVIPGSELSLAGRPIRLAKAPGPVDNTYRVNRCCKPVASTSDGTFLGYVKDKGAVVAESTKKFFNASDNCHDNYIFEVLNSTTFCPMMSVEIAAPNCDGISKLLRPVDQSLGPTLAAISKMTGRGPENLELIDSSGMVKIPVDPVTGRGPFGSLHHFANPRPEPGNSLAVSYDAFLHAKSACAFMRVLEAFKASCQGPECEVQWNDAYHPFLINGRMSHSSHTKDSCVDVFPISKKKREPSSIEFSSSDYDQVRTMNLINLMVKAGADVKQLGFNDPLARRRFGTQKWPGHDNHIHVCFPNSAAGRPELASNVQKVDQACSKGLINQQPTSPSAVAPASSVFSAGQCQ